MKTINLLVLTFVAVFFSCQFQQEKPVIPFNGDDPAVLQNSVKKLTDVIVYDIFSPPVASRIYAYTSLAAYEAIRYQDGQNYPSLTAKFHGFENMPQPDATLSYSFPLAGIKAYMTVAKEITFSIDTLKSFEQDLYEKYSSVLDKETFDRSLDFGEKVGETILKRAATDQYKETRGYARYTIQEREDRWKPTAPDYEDAAEPYWSHIKPLAMDSARHFEAKSPVPYSSDKASKFYEEVFKVYKIGNSLTKEQQEIATFWDDNPFVSHHKGHSMYARKKMTPGGHWMAIATLAAQKTDKNLLQTAEAYALTSSALFEGFISSFEEKYRSHVVRPITFINDHIDATWEPYLQTPPFPEYSSAHGTISASAATVLTNLFGDNFAYTDTTEVEYGMGKRSFNSFAEAAKEAAYSRYYGGIHYIFTCEESSVQGMKVGNLVLQKAGKIQKEDSKVVLVTDRKFN
ncbi:MAG: vanadium-dependent haloperoxidase [Candidatus Cyclobacteriaceae bacterium M2_1C_046]